MKTKLKSILAVALCAVGLAAFAEPDAVQLWENGPYWATCNVGASKPEDYGYYFAWGETSPKKKHSRTTLKYRTSGNSYFFDDKFSKYVTSRTYGPVDNKTILEPMDDAAHVNWGGSWRMPTDAEWTELEKNCTWTWTTQNGVNGYKVTSLKSGYTDKSIFLPAAGFRNYGDLYDAGSGGRYWSSSLSADDPCAAYGMCLSSDFFAGLYFYRSSGCSVRPVSE